MQNDNEGPRTAEGQAGGRNTEREGKKKKKARPRGTPSANSARGGSSPRVICPSAPPAAWVPLPQSRPFAVQDGRCAAPAVESPQAPGLPRRAPPTRWNSRAVESGGRRGSTRTHAASTHGGPTEET